MDYTLHLLTIIGIYSILAMSYNLVIGYAGIIAVAHAAFFGVGAYSTAILLKSTSFPFLPALAVSIAVTIVVALLLGAVLGRFRGDYVLLGSVGLNLILHRVFINWDSVTGGPVGIAGIPRLTFFGERIANGIPFFFTTLSTAVVMYLFYAWIVRSSFGRALQAIREDEDALKVFGYRVDHYKLLAYGFGAVGAAVAGSLYATYVTFIDPSTFTAFESLLLLAMVILGGIGNLPASIVGVAGLVILSEALRFLNVPAFVEANLRITLYGAVIVLMMYLRPQGLLGRYRF